MNPEVAIDIFKTTILFALYTAAPFLITMLVVGLLTSLFQSVTGVQEATLTFAPKLIAFSCVSLLLAPWLLHSLTEYTVAIFARMTAMAH
jgi:flagellar biosynthetic protein FliQ